MINTGSISNVQSAHLSNTIPRGGIPRAAGGVIYEPLRRAGGEEERSRGGENFCVGERLNEAGRFDSNDDKWIT